MEIKSSKQKGTIGKRRMIQTTTKIKYIKKQKREKKNRIDKILMEHRLSRSQPNQPIIAKKVDHEEAMDIITEKNPDVQNLEEKKQDEIVPKTYARVDQHFKKRPYRKSKKRCWYCGLLTMSKEIALKFDFSIVLSWDT